MVKRKINLTLDKIMTLCQNRSSSEGETSMGTTERREREKQQRRDDILNTARTIFFDKGFRDTTIDDIARATELARGTIYLYFESKEEIYATVLEEGLDILHTLVREAYSSEQDPLTNLLAGHDAFMRFHDEYKNHYNVLLLDKMQIEEVLPPELKSRLNAKFTGMAEWLAKILQEGIDQGFFRPMPVLEVAVLQMGICMGFAQMLDKCQTIFTDYAQSREAMHNLIAMGVMTRQRPADGV
jgi:TetR/AcrR family transcriptional regulator